MDPAGETCEPEGGWRQHMPLDVGEREAKGQKILRTLRQAGDLDGKAVLEIGTGTGVIPSMLSQAVGDGGSVQSIDVVDSRIYTSGYVFQVVSGVVLPFEADSFDVVTIHHVLHYADDPAAALAEAARVVRPGGVVLVVDFSPHDLVELKREHAHVHLGFADNQVQGWLKSAGLAPLEPIHFPGRRLMTGIWRGEREHAERPQATTTVPHGASR